jgi:hypothetical protein
MSAARESIFDSGERDDAKPAQHSESTFEFLNRVAGLYWGHPRQLMQAWADRIPDAQVYKDLRHRFRSRDDEQFRSAFLELYVHECLVRAGYAVTVHPVVPGTSRRPDFLAQRNDERVYVEAIAPGTNPESKASAKRRAVLFDTVNRLGDPNFMLWLEHLTEGRTPPASARLRADLRRWLAQLDPDSISNLEEAPSWRWQYDGWSVTFKPIPKRAEARGALPYDRAIGVYGHTEATIIDDAPAIRNALAAKHHAYGDLGSPFIVAVGTYIHDTDRWHSTNALYGQLAFQWGETLAGEVVTREVRQPDGYFGVPPEWRNHNVSGVLLVNQLMPYHVHRAETSLWHHPDPLHPLPAEVGFPGHVLDLRKGQLTEDRVELDSREFFGLSDPWPPGEPWPDD